MSNKQLSMREVCHDLILVDAHVHLRRCFEVVSFLNWAYANLKSVAQDLGHDRQFAGVLFLADAPGEDGFSRLMDELSRWEAKDEEEWRMYDTGHSSSVFIMAEDEKNLIVIAGRQIISQEDLEVLAIGTRQQFDHGKPIAMLIRDIAQAEAIPIVPWGAGKWIGERRNAIERLIRDPKLPPFFLGDSGSRPALWPRPSLFRLAEERGIRDLPGTDPLPFSKEIQRIGKFGFALDGALDMTAPARDIEQNLLNSAISIQPFGSGEEPLRFLRNQVRMQYRKLTSS